jgi:hypothetical protein
MLHRFIQHIRARRLNRRNNLACGRINFIKGGKLAWRLFAIDDGPDSFNWHREAPLTKIIFPYFGLAQDNKSSQCCSTSNQADLILKNSRGGQYNAW